FDAASATMRRELDEEIRGHGIRDYPDRYSTAATGPFAHSFINFYHDEIHGLFLEYLMTGDRAVFDLAEAAARHFMDVDIVHDGDRVGLPHDSGPNHTSERPYALNATLNGLVDLHFLAGDEDAWEAAL